MSSKHLLWLLLVACPGCTREPREAPSVRVGSKAFTESVILGDLLQQLAVSAGADATHVERLADTGKVWNPLLLGDLDAYCEYTGTLMQEILAEEKIRDEAGLRQALARRGIVMSRSLGFSNNYALGMLEEKANALGIRTISDLRQHPQLRLGLSTAFIKRADGWEGLKARYGLPYRTPDGMEHTLAYKGVVGSTLDVIDLYTTDAEIRRYKIRVLEDDRRYFPTYDAVILYRADLAERAPKVVEAFLRLEGLISPGTMQELNAEAAIDKKSESVVAANFLTEKLSLTTQVKEATLAERLLHRTWQHLRLVVVSLVLGILTAVPLGIVAARYPVVGQGILGLVGVVQTFPALALLSVLIVVFRGPGALPAMAALYVYCLLPIVRNTCTGLVDIPLNVRESAEALGLSSLARLWLVELPMASRSILAGIKTAAVINVGFATLGGLVGAGGYGDAIVAGLQRDDYVLIMEGAVPAMAMALVVQGMFEVLERVLVPRGLRLKVAT